MVNIIIGTTPTIIYKFKVVDVSDIETAVLTIQKRNQTIIEKDLSDAEVGTDTLSWTLTQEETLKIGISTARMMLNWVTNNGTRGASNEEQVVGVNNHIREVIV